MEGWVRASTEFVHQDQVSLIEFNLKGLWATPLKAYMLVNRKTFNNDVDDFLDRIFKVATSPTTLKFAQCTAMLDGDVTRRSQ